MRRIRCVKPEWLEDELLAMASPEARVLSIALMILADDQGRFRANRVMLAGQVFPAAPAMLESALAELEKLRFVTLYECDGQHYGEIRNWSKHQRIDKPTASKLPENTGTCESSESSREHSRGIQEDSVTPRASRASIPIHSFPDPEGVQGEPEPAKPPLARKPSHSGSVRRVFEAWKLDTGHHRATLDPKRAKRIEARLREGLTEQDLIDALEGRHFDEWLMGRGNSPRVFDEIDTLFRDAAQVERLRDLRHSGPQANDGQPPAASPEEIARRHAICDAADAKARAELMRDD